MSRIFQELLRRRDINEAYLHPKYEDCLDPNLLLGMDLAIKRIKQAVRSGENVLIYGDYDVDGVTASTAMHDVLKLCGVKIIEVMLPNRFTDGYGMSKKVIERAKEGNFTLVMTVDCGSRNHDIISELKNSQIDVIVTDHHECEETLPEAVAVINPKRPDQKNLPKELRDLAGVGVVFKLAQGLVKAGLIPEGQEKWLLDLVLIGTICDSMPLTAENRRFCYYGMKVLEKTRRAGLKELLRLINAKHISGDTIGFQIGPRLNAAGRLDSAEKSLSLLMADWRPAAAKIASELEELNRSRRSQQDSALRDIENSGIDNNPVIIVKGDWHEGILGIIAGRLTETYRKPSFVLAPSGENLKGSGRSFGDFNLAKTLEVCGDLIIKGGGHAEACGLTIKATDFEKFQEKVNQHYKDLKLHDQERFLEIQEDLAIENYEGLSLELIEELRELEPFGAHHEEPIFLLKDARVIEANRLGADENHLRLLVWDAAGNSMKLMWFYAPKEFLGLQGGETINAWVTLSENEFRGIRSPEGRIVKMAV